MKTCLRRGLYGALFAGGALVLGAGAASAATGDPVTITQATAPITAPVTVNLGGTQPLQSTPAIPAPTAVAPAGTGALVTGTRVTAPVTAPVTVNLGGTQPLQSTPAIPAPTTVAPTDTSAPLTGTRVTAPVTAPVTVNLGGTAPLQTAPAAAAPTAPAVPAPTGTGALLTGTQGALPAVGAGTLLTVGTDSLSGLGAVSGAGAEDDLQAALNGTLGLGADVTAVPASGAVTDGGPQNGTVGVVSYGAAGNTATPPNASAGLVVSASDTTSGNTAAVRSGFSAGAYGAADGSSETGIASAASASAPGAAGNGSFAGQGAAGPAPTPDMCPRETGASRLSATGPVNGQQSAGMASQLVVLGALAAVMLLLMLRRSAGTLPSGRRVGNWPDPCES